VPKSRPAYEPRPIDSSEVKLTKDILELTERLAENSHAVWARQRLADGWRYGPRRDDARKEHPSLIPYAELSESEKQYDRNAALETLKAVIALGYKLEKH
jgi:RyR domain